VFAVSLERCLAHLDRDRAAFQVVPAQPGIRVTYPYPSSLPIRVTHAPGMRPGILSREAPTQCQRLSPRSLSLSTSLAPQV